MNEQNNAYKKRGMSWLIAFLAEAVLSAVLFGWFWNKWPAAFGVMTGGVLVMLTKFIKLRRMTPEQFEAYRKKEKMDNDERATLIALKSCRAAFRAMLLAACAAFIVIALFCDNDLAMWLTLGLLLLGCAAYYIAREIYSQEL